MNADSGGAKTVETLASLEAMQAIGFAVERTAGFV